MAGGSSSFYQDDDAAAISDINVTPLVDVMLVLLIIFIAIAPLIANRGIKANLPSTEAGSEIKRKLALTLVCNPDREHPSDRCALDEEGVPDTALYVDDVRFTDRKQASATLDKRFAQDNDIAATIVADKIVPYGEIMKLLDLVKKSKINKFALASNRKAKAK